MKLWILDKKFWKLEICWLIKKIEFILRMGNLADRDAISFYLICLIKSILNINWRKFRQNLRQQKVVHVNDQEHVSSKGNSRLNYCPHKTGYIRILKLWIFILNPEMIDLVGMNPNRTTKKPCTLTNLHRALRQEISYQFPSSFAPHLWTNAMEGLFVCCCIRVPKGEPMTTML